MKLILGSIFAAVMLTMATVGTGCAASQLASDKALAEMEPESRVKYYEGLEYAELGAETALQGIKGAKDAFEKTYDPKTGEPLVPETPEAPADPVE